MNDTGQQRYFYTCIETAARRLDTTPDALRARCRRGSRRRGRDIVTELGDGIVAIKFGRAWRVRWPS